MIPRRMTFEYPLFDGVTMRESCWLWRGRVWRWRAVKV